MSEINLSEVSDEQLKEALKQRNEEKETIKLKARKSYENKKENFCIQALEAFSEINKSLKNLKEESCRTANELYEEMYELDGKKPKPTKSFAIKNEADTIKIVIDRQERLEFTSEAVVHINTIRDIFKRKFEDRNKAMYSILDGLLVKNSNKEYDAKLLAKARQSVRDLGDEELINEFDKLDGCQKVTGSAVYCRLYTKTENGKWLDIPLQFSSL